MADGWQAINNFANMAALTSTAISGVKVVVAGYQTYASPYTFLMQSGRKLKRVKSRLNGLSPERREEVEIATRTRATHCKSLKDLEGQLQGCVLLIYAHSFEFIFMAGFIRLEDTYDILTQGYGDMTYAERHLPYTEFRKSVSLLLTDACGLLNDTLVKFFIRLFLRSESHYLVVLQATTMPFLMDKGSSPEDPSWPSSSESPDTVSTPTTPLPLPIANTSKLPYFAIFLLN